MHWYIDVLKKYAVIEGRASRTEYWMFVLCNFIVSIFVSVAAAIISFKFLTTLYSLAVLIPSITVLARRLHDIGKSGWWILFVFLPIIGWVILLIFAIRDSQPGTNMYGPNPKGTNTPTPAPVVAETKESPVANPQNEVPTQNISEPVEEKPSVQ